MVVHESSPTAIPSADTAAKSSSIVVSAQSSAHFPIPNLIFENRTRFDAAQFDTVDQHSSAFHVVVAKNSYSLGARDANGMATLTRPSAVALNVEDRHFDDDCNASVRHESDFAPYKPACDVIVNATAHAPRGKPVTAFKVRLTVHQARQGRVTGQPPPLIDKTLSVTGERSFKKKMVLWRVLQWATTIATFGLLHPVPWRLSWAGQASPVPLRYEYANGGECRIDEGDSAAARVPKKARAPRGVPSTTGANPAAGVPIAHEASEANPLGRGFARPWYLDARRIKSLAAPRISAESKPLTARAFWRAVNGKALPEPVGMGAVGRGWLPRRALAGTFDDKATWGDDEVPSLPADFDFAFYNCAPPDQQCPYLNGSEDFALLNLCKPDHPSATVDAQGNAVLRFTLPQQAFFLLALDGSDNLLVKRMVIDTVIIEPDESRVDLVWRALLPTDAGLRVARLEHITEAAQLARLAELEQIQASHLEPDAPIARSSQAHAR